MKQKKDVQPGTPAPMAVKTLDVLGPLHGRHRIGAGLDQTAAIVAHFFEMNAGDLE
jgi:hypothetical protein